MAKEKVLSPEKFALKKQKEAKELAKWQAVKAKPKPKGYLIYMFLVCAVINIVDEICSNLSGNLKSVLATIFFEPVFGAEYAISRMDLFSMITYIFYGLAFLYKVLADRYGRRIFLVVNTLGMGVAMIIISVATNIPVYLIGTCFITFFTPHDMQMSYITESAPAEHRAKYCSVIKTTGSLFTLFIPVMRNLLISGSDYSRWRLMYIIPSIVALLAALAAFLMMRETDAFVDMRIKQLTMTDEEILEAKKNKKQDTTSRGGIFKSIKFIFTHKQLLWLALSVGMFTFMNTLVTNNEAIMTMNYANKYIAQGMTIEEAKLQAIDIVSKALLVLPIGNALIYFISGFVSDKIGRKPTAIILGIMCFIAAVVGYVGATFSFSPYIVGFLIGVALGSYWGANDNMYFVIQETAPTNLRNSVQAVFPIISGQFSLIAMGITTALNNILGDTKIGTVAILASIPGLIIFLITFIFKIKETKGVDFASIKGDEFE